MKYTLRILAFSVCPLAALSAQSLIEPDSLVHDGMRLTLACDFDGALRTFQSLADANPRDATGPFFLAATLQSKMMDTESDAWEKPFQENIRRVIDLEEPGLEPDAADARRLFFLGSAYSYLGLVEAKRGSLVSGLRHAHKGVGYLEKAIQADSTFYDAYLGVGNYKYWAGRFTKYLRWLPWIRDERTLGISMVQRSIERGKLSHWVGISSLGWIEYDRKHFDAGLELFLSGLREFPGSRFFLWGAADCAFGMRDFRLASQYYSQLLESIQRAPGQSGYNEAECRTKLMKSFEALREREGALTQAEAILAMKPVPAVESRIGRHRRAAIECRRRLLEHGEKDK